jgi:RNA polymerase sigma-70 factor (ECF subfamily)
MVLGVPDESILRVVPPPPDGPGPDQQRIAELVESSRDGDKSAFDELVAATYRANYTLALRLTSNSEDARDVTQEAYLRAYRSLENFRGDAQFATWMYRITANCASTHLGRRRRHRHDKLSADDQVVDIRPDSDPTACYEATELRGQVAEALESLPPKLRAVVVLRDVYELPHEAVAEELGISSTAAKVRLHRARTQLRSQLFPHLDEVESREV